MNFDHAKTNRKAKVACNDVIPEFTVFDRLFKQVYSSFKEIGSLPFTSLLNKSGIKFKFKFKYFLLKCVGNLIVLQGRHISYTSTCAPWAYYTLQLLTIIYMMDP